MSTHLDFRCLDCGEDAESNVQRFGLQNESMLALLDPVVRAALATLGSRPLDVGLTVGSSAIDLVFFAKHDGHRLALINGFGQVCKGAPDDWGPPAPVVP